MKTSKGGLLDNGVDMAMMIVLAIFILGAGAIGMTSLGSGVTTSAALYAPGNLTLPAINNGSSGLLNMSIQMPSVGTLAGVALLLLVLFGAFYMFMRRE